MNLWDIIKAFFSGEKSGENSGMNGLGDLEATVEAVSASEEDVTVELFEMTENTDFAPEEDPDIEVEIVDAEADDLSALSELGPVNCSADPESSDESADLSGENAEVCGEKTAESPSRMTEEYKQWLREQEALRDQTDHTTES